MAQTAPLPTLDGLEPRVAERVREAHAAVQRAPHEAPAWGTYGMVLDAHRFTGPASEAYERAHGLDPRDFRWPYFLGSLLDLSRPERAVEWYVIALEIDPAYGPARIRLGETLEKLGRIDDARREFARAADLDPSNPFAPFGLGRTALAEGHLDEAVRQLERAVELAPRLQAVVVTLARAYHRAGREEEAAATAARAHGLPRIAHHPDERRAAVGRLAVDRESRLRRARTHLDVGLSEEAIAEVGSVLAEHPDDVEALLVLAEARERRGETSAALLAAERAFQLGPDFPSAGTLLASLLFKAERFAEAEKRAEEVLESRLDVHMLLLLAMTAARRGDVAGMLRRLDVALEQGTDDPQLGRLLGSLLADVAASYADIGEIGEAVRRQEQAVSVLELAGVASEELAGMRAQLARYRDGL